MIGQDGGAHVNVEFRMIVFRPFKGEVLTGRISSATAAGVKVRTDFFDEVFVPAGALFEGSWLYVIISLSLHIYTDIWLCGGLLLIIGVGVGIIVMVRNRFGYGIMMIRTFIWIRMRLLGLGLRGRFLWINCLCRRI